MDSRGLLLVKVLPLPLLVFHISYLIYYNIICYIQHFYNNLYVIYILYISAILFTELYFVEIII